MHSTLLKTPVKQSFFLFLSVHTTTLTQADERTQRLLRGEPVGDDEELPDDDDPDMLWIKLLSAREAGSCALNEKIVFKNIIRYFDKKLATCRPNLPIFYTVDTQICQTDQTYSNLSNPAKSWC